MVKSVFSKKITNVTILLILLGLIISFIIFQKPLEQLYLRYVLKKGPNNSNGSLAEPSHNIYTIDSKNGPHDKLSNSQNGSTGSTDSSNSINESTSNSCSGTGSCVYNVNGKERKLLPVLDPMFNLREICKQIILLEDHLFQKGKRCNDCISKHFLYLEGLAEEAITLDHKRNYVKLLENLPDDFRILQKEYLKKVDPSIIAQKLRTVRKKYMENSFKFGEQC